jgi:SAM-dependent MidA family methyltransferase
MDITADVDFTSLALDARDAGLEPLAFMEMGTFLMAGARRLLDKGQETRDRGEDVSRVSGLMSGDRSLSEWAGLRYLVHPEGMGSAFQVLILGKGIDPDDWKFEGNRIKRLGL